jgi:hypothetical protein
MKIGILTQPLKTNYGGLLQAYALQKTLNDLDHETWIVDRDYPKLSFKKKVLNQIKKRIPIGEFSIQPNAKENEIIGKHTSYFKNKYIGPITEKITQSSEMQKLNALDFEAYVVGSDQVWRPKYSPGITNFFIDFAANEQDVKRLSYAASFGVEDWEFNEEQTSKCSMLAQEFDAISVRESSGINLSKKYLGVKATHVLDPTMLLSLKDYVNLIDEERESKNAGNLMTYVLDITEEKEKFINDVAEYLNLSPFTVMQKVKLSRKTNINDSIFPPVTKWLKGFLDARFVITDSFHGCAFAILFNKPFLALGNKKRGVARFTSLLKMFDLEDRLVLNDFNFNKSFLKTKINWNKVNIILESERKKSIYFLKNSLDKVR